MKASPKLRRLGCTGASLAAFAVFTICTLPLRGMAQTGDQSARRSLIAYQTFKEVYRDTTIGLKEKASLAVHTFNVFGYESGVAPVLNDTTSYLADFAGAAYLITGDTLAASHIVELAVARAPSDTTGMSERLKRYLFRIYEHRANIRITNHAGAFRTPWMALAFLTVLVVGVAVKAVVSASADDFAEKVRDRLREEIKRQDKKEGDLAGIWGLSSGGGVSNILNGHGSLSIRRVALACEWLGIDVGILITGRPESKPEEPPTLAEHLLGKATTMYFRIGGKRVMSQPFAPKPISDLDVDMDLDFGTEFYEESTMVVSPKSNSGAPQDQDGD